MNVVVAFFVGLLLCTAASAAEDSKRLIWGNIPFVKGASYYEFDAELSRTRAAARDQELGDFNALFMPLALSGDDMSRLARVLATTILQFDDLVRRHAREVHENVALSLAEDFKAGLERYYVDRRLNEEEQRSGLAFVSHEHLQAMSRDKLGLAEARALVHDLRYLAYGSYTVVSRGVVRATVNLEDLATLRVRTFSAQGPVAEVGEALADKVQDFLQSVPYPSWENPQPQLTWIAPAFPQTKVSAGLAAQYCASQRARLPYANELVQAALGSSARKGGIGPLIHNATYIVADRNRHDMQYYYTTGEEAQTQTGGPVHTSAGHGVLTGYYWCVRGQPSPETLFDQSLYRLMRQNEQQNRMQVVNALEYILAKRNDLGFDWSAAARGSDPRAFPSIENAVRFLAQNGVYIEYR
jgi:hypothetical protein